MQCKSGPKLSKSKGADSSWTEQQDFWPQRCRRKVENVSDAVKFLEAKVESLIRSVNRSFSLISRPAPKPSGKKIIKW